MESPAPCGRREVRFPRVGPPFPACASLARTIRETPGARSNHAAVSIGLRCAAVPRAAVSGAARAGVPPLNPDGTLPSLAPLLEADHAGCGEHRGAVQLARAGQSAVPGSLLPALLRVARPARAAPVRRLRRHRGRGRGLRADQPSRDPGRARGDGEPEGSAPAPGQDRRQRRRHRHRAAADRGRQSEGAGVWRLGRRSGWATTCWRSATPSASARPSPPASSAPWAAPGSTSKATRTSFRPTPRSTRATRAAHW